MREIKFRVWDAGAKHYSQAAHMMNVHTGKYSDSETRFTIEQYTGLHDKNGREIYEGDIISGLYHPYQVIFSEGCFSINWPGCCEVCARGSGTHGTLHEYLICSDYPSEVIGNKHENPELRAQGKGE